MSNQSTKNQQNKIAIGIDGNEANVAGRVGSNVFAYELLSAMERYLRENSPFEVVVYLSRQPLADLPAPRPGWRYEIVAHQPFWGQWRLPLALWTNRQIDLFFSPGHYLPSFAPVPLVSTIMDLAYEKFPTYFKSKDRYQLSLFTRWGVRQAKHLLAISQSTKRDLISLYHQPADKISVVYPAVKKVTPLRKAEVNRQLQELHLSEPYLLFVGTLQPRKNLERLIQAFEWLRINGFSGELVIAGRVGWQAEGILTTMKSSSVKEHIHHLGFVDDEQKQALIQGAQLLVLPGLYEGFGLPPLEAIAMGTLPVVSDISSLPEVVPIKELRFNPEDVSDIGKTILNVWEQSDTQKKSWLQQLQAESAKFDWDKSAKQVCEILRKQVEDQHENSRH